jgi:diphthamide biosynthesis methyltransferase
MLYIIGLGLCDEKDITVRCAREKEKRGGGDG